MKKLSKRENQIMIALWNSSVPLPASALKKNLDEDVSISSTSRNFYTSIQKKHPVVLSQRVFFYDSFNACTILLTLSI